MSGTAMAAQPGLIGRCTLADLAPGSRARVVRVVVPESAVTARRLMDLGFTEGARIKPVLRTFAGDPRAYEVRGTLIALRRDQAAHVLVKAS